MDRPPVQTRDGNREGERVRRRDRSTDVQQLICSTLVRRRRRRRVVVYSHTRRRRR